MYQQEDYEQLDLELLFGVPMREDNHRVILSKFSPEDH